MNALSEALKTTSADAEVIKIAAGLDLSGVMHANPNDQTPGVQFAGVNFYKFREAFCVGSDKIQGAMNVLNAMRDAEEDAR